MVVMGVAFVRKKYDLKKTILSITDKLIDA